MKTLAPGLTANDSATLTAAMEAFLDALRDVVPAEVPIHVNSGVRAAESQAAAMLRKLADGDDLVALYRPNAARIQELLALPHDAAVWGARIAEWMSEGVYISRHLRGQAVDLRINDLTADAVAKLIDGAKALGARTLLESTPSHLHVDLPAPGGILRLPPQGGTSRVRPTTSATSGRTVLPVLLAVAAVGATVGAGLWFGAPLALAAAVSRSSAVRMIYTFLR